MKENFGFLGIARKFQDHFLWKERRVFSSAEAWIDILFEVRWKKEPSEVLIGRTILYCNYSECLYSLDTWANRWKWSKSKVKRFLNLLAECSMIELKNETVTTRIKVLNYSKYNDLRHTSDTQEKRKRNARETQAEPTEPREPKKQREPIKQKENTSAPNRKKASGSSAAPSKIKINLNLETYRWENITDEDLSRWKVAYPACDSTIELAKAAEWIRANPTKVKSNWLRFLTNWFSRSQERGGSNGNKPSIQRLQQRPESMEDDDYYSGYKRA